MNTKTQKTYKDSTMMKLQGTGRGQERELGC